MCVYLRVSSNFSAAWSKVSFTLPWTRNYIICVFLIVCDTVNSKGELWRGSQGKKEGSSWVKRVNTAQGAGIFLLPLSLQRLALPCHWPKPSAGGLHSDGAKTHAWGKDIPALTAESWIKHLLLSQSRSITTHSVSLSKKDCLVQTGPQFCLLSSSLGSPTNHLPSCQHPWWSLNPLPPWPFLTFFLFPLPFPILIVLLIWDS